MHLPILAVKTASPNDTVSTLSTSTTSDTIKTTNTEDHWTSPLAKNVFGNGTMPHLRIQTAFRVNGYSRYEKTSGLSGGESSQNQMIPIYCSVMGLVIVIVLVYVVYKLWKQRDSVINAKLAGGYGMISCNSHSGHNASTVRGRSTTTIFDGKFQQEDLSAGGNNIDSSQNAVIRRGSVEKAPLINRSVDSRHTNDMAEKPLTCLSCKAMGILCFQLALDGWKRLAEIMDFNPSDMKPDEETSNSSKVIIQAALHAQHISSGSTPDQQSPETEELINTAILLSKICAKANMNINTLSDALVQIDRADLIPPLLPGVSSNPKALEGYVA